MAESRFRNRNSPAHGIEILEPRIAPAAILQITDLDGDIVTIKTSKGTLAQLTAAVKLSGVGLTGTIQEIDFSTVPLVNGVNPFAGTDLTIAVKTRGAAGDGRVHVGYIDASALDDAGLDGAAIRLGRVKVAGDLAQIDVGGGGFAPALKSLQVQTMGAFGTSTQAAGGTLTSNILGAVGSFKVSGAITGATLVFTAPTTAVNIGGALLGSSITGAGEFGSLRIGGQVSSGSSITADSVDSLWINGLVAGTINAPDIGRLTIRGDLLGGIINVQHLVKGVITGSLVGVDGAPNTGSIFATGNVGSLTIGHNLDGASASKTARVEVAGNIGSIVIGGSILGPNAARTTSPLVFRPVNSAAVVAGGNISSFTLGGDLIGPWHLGVANSSAYAASSCSVIMSNGDIGKLSIGGSVVGAIGFEAGTGGNVQISAEHMGVVTVRNDITGSSDIPKILAEGGDARLAIAKLTVGGSVSRALIQVGKKDNFSGAPENADAKIGAVIIRGDLASASILASDDGGMVVDDVNLFSRIGSVRIDGQITGNSSIRAEEIVKAQIGGKFLVLEPGKQNDLAPIVFLPGAGSLAEYN